MNRLMGIAVFAVLLMVGVAQFLGASPAGSVKGAASDEASPHVLDAGSAPEAGAFTATSGETQSISRGADGQFHVNAAVNGEDASFLVDTGADMVALTTDEADQLGLFVDPAAFRPILQTASGKGYGQRVRLDRLAIGGRELTNVDAVVVQGLSTNLLGQSVLRRLGRVELRGDRLVIEPD